MKINTATLHTLVEEVNAFRPAFPAGYMTRTVYQEGVYQEGGLTVTRQDLPLGHLYAGLAVLARDMHHYLARHPRPDADVFEQAVAQVNRADASYGDQAFPHYGGPLQPLADALPGQLATAAAAGHPQLQALGDRAIVHEWTFKPGRKLFLTCLELWGPAIHDALCHEKALHHRPAGPSAARVHRVSQTASLILTALNFDDPFWYPLVVYLSFLLVEKGLAAWCAGEAL